MSLSTRSARQHQVIRHSVEERAEGLCRLYGTEFYRIYNYDRLPPFLMSIVSDTDLWMYISSTGGLTAGRQDEDHALFPYETDDRLHKCSHTTGPFTLLRVTVPGKDAVLWQPFSDQLVRPHVQRNLYKSILSNQIVFEESHVELGLRFRYRWRSSDEFGFVRTCSIESNRETKITIDVIDGLLNILPAGVDLVTHQRASCLINAYSQTEIDVATSLATYSMSSLIVDKAEAADSLRANVVWSFGIPDQRVLLSQNQISAFAAGKAIRPEKNSRGTRGSYLISGRLSIKRSSECRWDIIADAARDQAAVEALRSQLQGDADLAALLEQSISDADDNLMRNLASADGLQLTADRIVCQHHLANVLFNNMRGGVFADNGTVIGIDLRSSMVERNRKVADKASDFFATQPARQSISAWLAAAERENNPDLIRLCYEYLPITFSRRHGDPSRPWNRFKIAVKDEQGNKILNYQGNWRDIFQNWEALLTSFPEYIESVIAKFVNASTLDGFNPYRITRQGMEWERPDPHDPWANIGYWGDHQIVYLLRLLELSRSYHARRLNSLLEKQIFTYANVPYRLKPYSELLVDRSNTIIFDRTLDKAIQSRSTEFGSDAKLITDRDCHVLHVTLLEKLLIPVLSKLSSLVVDAGIWMNTQRPEWNDANNALVGNGISMVTLYHLRRYIKTLQEIIANLANSSVSISLEVVSWLRNILRIFGENQLLLEEATVTDLARRDVLDQLGTAFCNYRKAVYANGLSQPIYIETEEIAQLLSLSIGYLGHAIAANRRSDGLYHAYNVGKFTPNEKPLEIDRLPLMLEGQVAVLSSGALSPDQAVTLLENLFDSPLYRDDQSSFMLYPDRNLPGFLNRNIVPLELIRKNLLLLQITRSGVPSLIAQDAAGNYRFCGSPRNSSDLDRRLDALAQDSQWSTLVSQHRQGVLDIYESIVHHHQFTGRSGAMYGYEGLGCIYWHMVSKLLLAVQESYWSASELRGASNQTDRLAELYYKVRKGLSFNKTADEYGAIPLDPYSHTPGHAGAQQPGMTGQVKEEILARAGELGVRIHDGVIAFTPILLKESEFITSSAMWEYYDLAGNKQQLLLSAGVMGFTLCQTPVRMMKGERPFIVIKFSNGDTEMIHGSTLSRTVSQSLFDRTGLIQSIDVTTCTKTIN